MAAVHLKKLWRGLDLGRLNKLKHALDMVMNRDAKIYQTVTGENELAFFFVDPDDQALLDKVNDIYARIASCKAEKI